MATKTGMGNQSLIEIVLIVLLIILVIYSVTFKTPILTTVKPHIQLPQDLTSSGNLTQAVNDLNSLPH